ncbi:hypothetical protein BCY86_08240 [Pajaroellobacter abortibovis]|uniref:Uncharacterized protein n=1 Tax=Pajaroellobacter abortibovis TaxID=1882918 RepID=A0A1L6MYQ5_9BACT|nr:hypothetical protein BCY86_08240 [Pajaroellobacter abortibovis]
MISLAGLGFWLEVEPNLISSSGGGIPRPIADGGIVLSAKDQYKNGGFSRNCIWGAFQPLEKV